MHRSALAGGQHHDGHDALAIDQRGGTAAHPDLAGEAVGDGDELGRRTRVQAKLVDDGDFAGGHGFTYS